MLHRLDPGKRRTGASGKAFLSPPLISDGCVGRLLLLASVPTWAGTLSTPVVVGGFASAGLNVNNNDNDNNGVVSLPCHPRFLPLSSLRTGICLYTMSCDPLLLAPASVSMGRTEVVGTLPENNATVERLNRWGMTPLFAATYHRHPKIVTLLKSAGATRLTLRSDLLLQGACSPYWAAPTECSHPLDG